VYIDTLVSKYGEFDEVISRYGALNNLLRIYVDNLREKYGQNISINVFLPMGLYKPTDIDFIPCVDALMSIEQNGLDTIDQNIALTIIANKRTFIDIVKMIHISGINSFCMSQFCNHMLIKSDDKLYGPIDLSCIIEEKIEEYQRCIIDNHRADMSDVELVKHSIIDLLLNKSLAQKIAGEFSHWNDSSDDSEIVQQVRNTFSNLVKVAKEKNALTDDAFSSYSGTEKDIGSDRAEKRVLLDSKIENNGLDPETVKNYDKNITDVISSLNILTKK
jgi:hypothetical protein